MMWDEETAEAQELFGDEVPIEFPEAHRFELPERCHWRDVRETPANVGNALGHAMREIERLNPDTLYWVFGAADWGNREILSDEVLKDLIEGLSVVSLGNCVVATDVLGDAYEYLIGKFADVTKWKKAGEFYTPRSVAPQPLLASKTKAHEGASSLGPVSTKPTQGARREAGFLLLEHAYSGQKGGLRLKGERRWFNTFIRTWCLRWIELGHSDASCSWQAWTRTSSSQSSMGL